MKKLIFTIFILLFSLIFISCNEDSYYNVTFKVEQEETVIKVKENTKVSKPTDPILEDYEFKGWYLDNELYDFNTLVTKDITLVASFDKYFTVTFKVDQEETVIKVKENTKVTKPSDPVIEDHEFKGWYLDNELYDFNTLVTKDITLVASFEGYFIVTFKVDQEETIIKVKENTAINKPTDPIKDDYEFKGWYLDNELYDFNTLVTKDIILIASFDKIKPIIEISVESNKLNMGYSTQIESIFNNTEELKLSYEVDKEGIVYINSKGLVTALVPGVVRIKAYHEDIYSNEIEIEVLEEVLNEDKIDLKGYTITHNDSLFLHTEALEQSDLIGDKSIYQLKLYIEEKYNCKIEYVDQSIEKDRIIELGFHGNLAYYGQPKDLTDVVNKYASKYPTIFDDNQYVYMVNGDKIYNLCVYRDISYSQGFYYNSKFLKELGLKDPLDLYLEGKWTYSNFISWCQKAKEILDGHPIFDKYGNKISVIYDSDNAMYYGMMTTIGKRIIDPIEQKDNINCDESQEIKKVINYLEDQEMINDISYKCLLIASGGSFPYTFHVGGDYDYGACQIDNPSLVPYPYPDDFDPNNVYFREEMYRDLAFNASQDISYPDGVEFEDIFIVIMELFELYGNIADFYTESILNYNSFIHEMDERSIELLNNVPDERFLYQYVDNGICLRNYVNSYLNNYDFKYYDQLNEIYRKCNIKK